MPTYKDDSSKSGKCWYFKVSVKGKQYKSKRYETKKECQEAERLYLLENSTISSATFNDVYNSYLRDYKTTNKASSVYTLEGRMKHLLPYFKNMRIDKIKLLDVHKWLNSINVSTTMKNNLIIYLKAILTYANVMYDINTMNVNLIKKIPIKTKKEEMVIWTYEDFKKFISQVDDLQDRCMFMLLYYGGIRKGELQALQIKDFKKNTITINKTYAKQGKDKYTLTPPKTINSYRTIELPDIVVSELKELIKFYKTGVGYNDEWFLIGGYKPIPSTNIRRHFDKYLQGLDLPPITIHGLRHSAVSLLINLGENEYVIAKRMGHTPTMVRETYAHLFPNDLHNAVDKLNNLK